MARIIPSPMPPVLQEPRRAAERQLYERLSAVLPASTFVFHGVAWLARLRRDGARDGETDFVIVAPERGILVLEVKGGRIARDGVSGRWSSTDREGAVHDIPDPIAQARTSHHALAEKIRSLPAWRARQFLIGHAVAFPDCSTAARALAPDLPREIAILADDLGWLDRKIESVFDHWQGAADRLPLDGGALRSLEDLLAPSFELRQPLGPEIRTTDRDIIRLTEEQFTVLDGLRRQRRVKIRGGAGTGKTVLALEKAKRLAAEGFRTWLTCFNRPLAEHLQRSAGKVDGLRIDTFHELCADMARRMQLDIPNRDASEPLPEAEAKRYFGEILPEALKVGMDEFPEQRFDAIVVDEGQDFDENWWVALQLALRDPDDGILYVFYDGNQRIYRARPALPECGVEFDLTRNLRNTRAIQRLAARFYPEGDIEAAGPEGRPVELIAASGAQSVRSAVSRVVHRLIAEEGIATRDIALLTGRSPQKSVFAAESRLGPVALTRDSHDTQKLLLESVHRFKGLERPVVVLAEIDGAMHQQRLEILYVGLTRARAHLAVVAAQSTIDRLHQEEA